MIYYLNSVGTTHIKIGYTKKSPSNRLKELQTGSSFSLQLLASERGDMTYEKLLHKKFNGTHILLEWFDVSDELLSHINNISDYYVECDGKGIQMYSKMKQ